MTTANKQRQWNERYSSEELVWGIEPNRFLAEELGDAEPVGRVLDLACGEGRNAIWLAERGFEVTAVDFSEVAIERARGLADRRGVDVEWICADVTSYEPPPEAFERVVVLYLHLPEADQARALRHAVAALAPGGALLMIGHALRNLTEERRRPAAPRRAVGPRLPLQSARRARPRGGTCRGADSGGGREGPRDRQSRLRAPTGCVIIRRMEPDRSQPRRVRGKRARA